MRGRGFTLIELLVVIAILGILMSMIAAGAVGARRKAAVTKAKATIAGLEVEISRYTGDIGDYPPTGIEELVEVFENDPGDIDWDGPYMEFKEKEIEGGAFLDPWGEPYVYVSINGGAPVHRERSYDLHSFGPNGVDDDGLEDDVTNW